MDIKKKSFLSEKDLFELERKLERIYRNQSKRFKFTGKYVGEYTNKTDKHILAESPSAPTNSPANSKDADSSETTSPDTDSRELDVSQDEKPKLKRITSNVDIVDTSRLCTSEESPILNPPPSTAKSNTHLDR